MTTQPPAAGADARALAREVLYEAERAFAGPGRLYRTDAAQSAIVEAMLTFAQSSPAKHLAVANAEPGGAAKPVAWRYRFKDEHAHMAKGGNNWVLAGQDPEISRVSAWRNLRIIEPLYATPGTTTARGDALREALEALDEAVALIQEAKGADGPDGGFVTDHLDFAESWLDRIRAALANPPAMQVPGREDVSGIFQVPSDVAARQLMGLYYELSGNHDMAADVRSDDWEAGTGFGPGSERQLLAVMAALVEAVRKEALSQARGEVAEEGVRDAAQFLCDRLDDLEWHEGALENTLRDFMGHVDPAHARLKAALSQPVEAQ